jgi:S1-C subfamily serine protease
MKLVSVRNKKRLQTTLILNLILFASCFLPNYVSAQRTVDKKLTPREIAQQTLPSTVLLVMGNSDTKEIKSGSGFFIAEDIVVTNFHVIKETTEGYAKIYGQDKIYEILGVVGVDEKN